jgi:hypothetical protein
MSRARKALAMVAALGASLVLAPAARADGTETLGPPSIPIESGSSALVAGVGTQPYADSPVSFTFAVPAGATIKQVLAYWSGHTTGTTTGNPTGSQPDANIAFNGKDVAGTLIGGPSNFYLLEYFSSYRADVTNLGLVKAGSNSIQVSKMNFKSSTLSPTGNEGAALVVIYDLPGTSKVAGIRDGSDLAWDGWSGAFKTTVPQTFNFAASTTARAASLGLLVGSAYGPQSTGVYGNVVRGTFNTGETFSIVNTLQANQGFKLDTANLPVTIPPNATSVTVEIDSEGGDTPGSITWTMASLSVEGNETPPTEVPCTPGADNTKWAAWLAWWKAYLAKKYGTAYADKFAKYFDGGDCTSGDGDGCRPGKGIFGFYWHRKDCAPPAETCRNPKTLVELIKFLRYGPVWCKY